MLARLVLLASQRFRIARGVRFLASPQFRITGLAVLKFNSETNNNLAQYPFILRAEGEFLWNLNL